MDIEIDYTAASSWDDEMIERLAYLRENHPVYWSEANQMWVVTRFEDVSYVSKNNHIFCSGQGIRPGNPQKLTLIDEDEPRHGQLRKLLNKGFTPRMVKKLEIAFTEIVTECIDAIAKQDHCDFVDDLAVPMPLLLIAEMIGIRREDRKRFHQWSDALIAADGNLGDPEVMAKAGQAFVEYTIYLKEIMEDRRREPKDDLMSVLVGADEQGLIGKIENHGEVEGVINIDKEALADDELQMMMVLLLVAGNETTRNGMSGGMELLMNHPDQRQKLIDDPSLIPTAVEEMLRLTTPVHCFGRTATEDTELRGQKIKKGTPVLMCYGAANRDPREFDEPEKFDVTRNPHHLAFGIGNHFCLGANLARMELRVAFGELLRRLPDMQYAQGGPEKTPSALVRSVTHMYVKYTPEA